MKDYRKQNKATWINGMCVLKSDVPRLLEKKREYEKTNLVSSRDIPLPQEIEKKLPVSFEIENQQQSDPIPNVVKNANYDNTTSRRFLQGTWKFKNCDTCSYDYLEVNGIGHLCNHESIKSGNGMFRELAKWVFQNWDLLSHSCKPTADNCPGWKEKDK